MRLPYWLYCTLMRVQWLPGVSAVLCRSECGVGDGVIARCERCR